MKKNYFTPEIEPMKILDDQKPAEETVQPGTKEVAQINVQEAQTNIRSKASWFFWIAGLSLINTFMTARGSYFIAGLAISQVIDGVVIELTGAVNYFISLIAPAVFVIFGIFAFKFKRWAFIVGSIIYILDTGLYLASQGWLAAAFHAFVLYKLYLGYRAITEYEEENAKLW